jgi:hypothetical protein
MNSGKVYQNAIGNYHLFIKQRQLYPISIENFSERPTKGLLKLKSELPMNYKHWNMLYPQ